MPELELYGSARLETSSPDSTAAIESPSGSASFPLGHNPGDPSHGLSFDFSKQGGHGMFFGATRAGKFVNILAPALLTCNLNAVVTDPKGQAAFETGLRREAMGFRCVYLDPWGEMKRRYGVDTPVSKFNPLSALDPASETFNDDVSTIADALIVVGPGQDSHWTDSARELVAGLIAAVVEINPGKASLRDMRQLVTATDEELVAKIAQIHARDPNSLAGRKLRRFATKPNTKGELVVSDEITSIRSTAETQTAILDSEALLTAMETDDPPFNLADLILGKVTLYLVLPPDRLNTHGRWLRLILTLAIRNISRVGKSYSERPCCFWLDEFSSLGNLRMIEDSFGLMAGLGCRLFAFLQDLSQLQRDYPHSWETFISNSSLVQLLQCADKITAQYFSELLGTMTVDAKTGSSTYKLKPYPANTSHLAVVIKAFAEHTMQQNGISREEAYEFATALAHNKINGQVGKTDGQGKNYSDYRLANGRLVPWVAIQVWMKFNTELHTIAGYEDFRKEGYYSWEADTQPAARPVMLPQEIRKADRSKSIILMPDTGNFQLTRWEYYSDPVLSPWARHDPNRPRPVIKPRSTPPPAPTAQAGPIMVDGVPSPFQPAANDNRSKPPQSAAGAAVSFLKDRLNR